jgi:hypothetical protein
LEEGECSDDEVYEGPENCPSPMRRRSSSASESDGSASSDDFTEKMADKRQKSAKRKAAADGSNLEGLPDDPELLDADVRAGDDPLSRLQAGSSKSSRSAGAAAVHSSARNLPNASTFDPERDDQYDSEGDEDVEEPPPPPGSDAKGTGGKRTDAKKATIVPAKLLFQQLKEQRSKPKQQPKLYHAADRPRITEAQVAGPALPPADDLRTAAAAGKVKKAKKEKKAKVPVLTPAFYEQLKAKEQSHKHAKSAMNEKLEALKAQRLALEQKHREAAELAMRKATLAAAAAAEPSSTSGKKVRIKISEEYKRQEEYDTWNFGASIETVLSY